MNDSSSALLAPPPDADLCDGLALALEQRGYVILEDALPPALLSLLRARLQALRDDAFQPAGIGREQAFQQNRRIRGDRIHWLDPLDAGTRAWFDWIEALRLALNRRLFLGLFDYECHYACYPPGAFYRTHRDSFRGSNTRVVSSILYLNPQWSAGDGGELLLYAPEGGALLERIAPRLGTLVLFLSEDFPHEVLPARRERYSVTGWFRVNGSREDQPDPPL